jgi:glycerol-3-phosphate dehydrogenase
MAEEVVDNAVFVAKLARKECLTKTLQIGDKRINVFSNETNTFSKEEIEHFIINEMAVTVEDILARRTRLLFLDAKAAMDAAPLVAEHMALIMHKDQQWIQQQTQSF